jgi:hypothetical protein
MTASAISRRQAAVRRSANLSFVQTYTERCVMLPSSRHSLILLLSIAACNVDPARGSERGWNARDTITALGEQGAFTAFIDTEYATHSRSFRVRYWRGPCMLYWSGEAREGGMISMSSFKSAEIDKEGRLLFLGREEQPYLVLSAQLSEDERLRATKAMDAIIDECRGPD